MYVSETIKIWVVHVMCFSHYSFTMCMHAYHLIILYFLRFSVPILLFTQFSNVIYLFYKRCTFIIIKNTASFFLICTTLHNIQREFSVRTFIVKNIYSLL